MRNAGALGGIGAGHGPLIGAIAVTVLVLMGARVVDWVRRGRLSAWTAGMLVGGAVSNVIDRLVFGNVRDFLVVGRLVVNVADLAVLAGIGFYCYATLQSRPRNARAVTGCAGR